VTDQCKRRLRAPEVRTLKVRLLGGREVWVTTTYCGPRRTGRQRKKRGLEGSGLYPELAVLGIREGSTPALLSKVGRMTALLPSYAVAQRELKATGCQLDVKVVHRIARQLGGELLTVRARDVELFRAGKLPQGDALAGKRVGVAVDGGRVRLRYQTRKQKGRGKNKTQRRKLRVEWREPKVLIIFEMDDRGRMVRGSRPWIDGTFDGPDEVMELLAMHLHRLGAASATRVAFMADGAPWMWDRIEGVLKQVGVPPKRAHYVLDWSHALHYVSLAVQKLPVDTAERRRLYQKYRKWMSKGKVDLVIAELAVGADQVDDIATELAYLEKHANAGHMNYAQFRRKGIPLGSGAIESAIRRVVNLRLKGSGLLWCEENAEGMLLLRANVLTGRWEESQDELGRRLASDRQLQLKPPHIPAQKTTQVKGQQASTNAAA
jgi:hypothetical protein